MMTDFTRLLATVCKSTAIWQLRRIWHQTFDRMQSALIIFKVWNRTKQPLRIRMMLFSCENVLQTAIFHCLTCVNDSYLVTSLSHNAQIMRDHNNGGSIFSL